MSRTPARGLALFLAALPLSLLTHCGGNGQSPLPEVGANEQIRTGIPDPGSSRDNCAMADAFEIEVQHDFNASFTDSCSTSPTSGQQLFAAPTWFIFSDGTASFVKPLAVELRAPESTPPNTGWGLDAYPAASVPGGGPCGSTDGGVLRLWGGPFALWGGGVGSGYFNGQVQLGQFDASEFEGIAFWARRGPEGQGALRVNVIDQQISEEYAKTFYAMGEEPPFCKIAVRCDCVNGKPCTFYDPADYDRPQTSAAPPGHYCWDPETDPFPDDPQPDPLSCLVEGADGELEPPQRDINVVPRIAPRMCGDTLCQNDFDLRPALAATPLNFGANLGSACTERVFENNLSGLYCGNPDEHIPEPTERCGNTYSAVVQVDMDWKLYTIPFEELLQADYAYKGDRIDPSSIWGLGFGWVGGWVDFYIDDVGFYRRL